MAFAKKYNAYFQWGYVSTSQYEIAVYEDSFAGSVTQLDLIAESVQKGSEGQREDVSDAIQGSFLQFTFLLENPAQLVTYDGEFFKIDYKEKIVKLIKDPSGSADIKFSGILQPENCYRQYRDYKYRYTIKANDGLAELKNVYYTSDGTEGGAIYHGFENILTIIKRALSKVADYSDLQLDFRIQLNTYSDLMASTENAFAENEIIQNVFHSDTNGEVIPNTCYEVLTKILVPFYCSMQQVNGYWWIFCNNERASYYYEYDWATLTQQSRTSYTRSENIYQASDKKNPIGEGNLYKMSGIQNLNITIKNKDSELPLVTNEQFESDLTGWDNGDADDDSNDFTVISWDDLAGVGGTLEATWAGSATAGKYNFHHDTPFTVDLANDPGIVVRYAVQVTSATPALGNPKVQVRLWNATNGYLSSGSGQHNLTLLGNMYTFEDTFNTSSLTVALNYLDFELEVVAPTTVQITINVDYIEVTQLSDFEPTDYKIPMMRTSLVCSGTENLDVYISDQVESESDSMSIRDAGGSYTSTWNRYGETDNLTLPLLLGMMLLNNNNTYMDYVKVVIYDPNEEYEPHLLLYDSSVSVRYYRIIGYTINYNRAEWELDLKEIDIIGTDVTWFSSIKKLTSSYD